MNDDSVTCFGCANKGDARENWILRKSFYERLLDVEAILNECNSSVAFCDSRSDQLRYRWVDIRNVLGSDDYKVEWRNFLPSSRNDV